MKLLLTSSLLALSLLSAPVLLAQDATTTTNSNACASGIIEQVNNGNFTKARYSIKGGWKLSRDCTSQTISFDEDFKTKGGPDLKVYLSKLPIETLKSGSVEASSKKLSVLKSNKGAQSYIIPADINLSEYKSVIIHCEAFTVLWGGFDLPQ